jgi:colanic acid/amylovoran biosynthesis glycosyltransferase
VHGETGLVVARPEPEDLAARLEDLAINPEMRLAMGWAARDRAVRQFRAADQLAAFESLYCSLAAAHEPHQGSHVLVADTIDAN